MKDQIRETSDFVCEKLISKVSFFTGMSILEPSCGEGKIIEYLVGKKEAGWKFQITGVELNDDKYEKCKSNLLPIINDGNFCRHNLELHHCDFLKFENQHLYDAIIACPPFKGNVDLIHIKRMYDMLRNDGILVSLTSPYWITNNEPIHVEFRGWLLDKNYTFELLPDNSFMEKGKNVPTGILTING